MCPDLVSNVELTEVMRWKETAIYGYDDLDFSVAVTGVEQVAYLHLQQPQLQRQGSKARGQQAYAGSWTESSESIDTIQLKRGTLYILIFIYTGVKITSRGARDKFNFRQDKHIFPPNVRWASKKFSASLFDNIFRTSYLVKI